MTVKEKLKSIWTQYYKDNKWYDGEEPTDGDLLDFLNEGNIVQNKKLSGSRWWNNMNRVSEVEGVYFSYDWAETTGDMGIWEAGWEFNWSSLREVEPYDEVITVTKYRYK
jgi:hypothetical protein